MSDTLAELQEEVARNKSVIESAVTLINGLHAHLDAAGTDPNRLAQLRDDLKTQSDALAQAVAANTPAAGQATPQPAPDASAAATQEQGAAPASDTAGTAPSAA